MTALKQEKLLESNDLRNQLIERTEVLTKVKELFLIPGLEMMTTRQVADFYEVELPVSVCCPRVFHIIVFRLLCP